ncbi:MAG: hypothetical protein GY703_13410 [Gammaproteobacteria bacterium]|nr:hypothetical protein [Gammaproteobacteria bacterium]
MKLVLAIVATFLVTGPMGIVVGYKMSERQQYEKGLSHGRLETLQQLSDDIREHLGHQVANRPDPGSQFPKALYGVKDQAIYVTEVNGIRTLATNP